MSFDCGISPDNAPTQIVLNMTQFIARRPAAQAKASARAKLLAWTQGVLDGLHDEDDDEEATNMEAEEEEEDEAADDPDTTMYILWFVTAWLGV